MELKKNFHTIFLCLILLIGVIVRLQNFSLPPIDAHPMRQTDTECVAYNFAYSDSNILHPKACLIRPQMNREGYFFLEFPLYQYSLGMLYKIFGSGIAVARLFNIGLYVTAALSFYYFVKLLANKCTSRIAMFFFTFAPGSIFFIGHAIHPDVFAVSTVALSLALNIHSLQKKNTKLFALSILLFSISVATRPFGLLALPSFMYLIYVHKGRYWQYALLSIGSLFLYGLWRIYLMQFPKNYHEWEYWVLQGRELLKSPQTLKQLLIRNVTGEIVGKINGVFTMIGTLLGLLERNKAAMFSVLWLLGVPIYWLAIPNGNIFHQYYANVYLLPIIIMASLGFKGIFDRIQVKPLKLSFIVIVALAVIYNGFRTSSYFFNDIESPRYLKIAEVIEKHIPHDKKSVYTATLNSIPLSLAHRQGWVLGAGDVDVDNNAESILNMRQYGAEYVILGFENVDINPLEVEKIAQESDVVVQNKWATIYKMRQP